MGEPQDELRISLCGGLAVELGGARIEEELPGRQGRELFAYLVVHRDRPVSRDELLGVLWPDRAPRSPEAGLSTVLARLRRALGAHLLSGRAQLTLSLPPGTWIDVEEAHVAADRAETALADGEGGGGGEGQDHALAGLALLSAPPVPEFDAQWARQAREQADELTSQLLELVAVAGIRAGGPRLAEAERAARRMVERQPFRESGHGLLMQALSARGDVAEALRTFEDLRATLMDELGALPSADVVNLHEQLLRGAPAPAGGPASAPALPPVLARNAGKAWVGRSSDLDLLHEQWEASAAGARITSLIGEAGIGKTMLAARFAHDVHAEGATVLYGRADEEAVVPYSAFVESLRHYVVHTPRAALEDALGPHLPELGSLIPELADARSAPRGSGDADLRRLHLFQAAAAMLAHAASRGPMLLVLEDLHWSDAGTLLMLRHVMREMQPSRVLVLLTYRDAEMDPATPLMPLVVDLRRENDIARIPLRGFDEEEIATLLHEAEQTPSPQLVRRLRDHTSGNPLFMEEIVRSAREAEISLSELDADELEQLEIPEGVIDVIRRRLSRLSGPSVEALAAAAVLGRDFRVDALEAALGDEDNAALAAVDEALGARLLVEDPGHGERYAFSHALVRDSIYRGMSRGRRARLHRRVALALEARRGPLGVEAAELAHHFVQAGQADLAGQAVAYSREAAVRSLQAHAYEEAARHGRNALSTLERYRPQQLDARCETLLELSAVAWQASVPDARAISEQAVEAARAVGGGAPLAAAALSFGGRFYAQVRFNPRTLAVLEEALAGLDAGDSLLRARLLARLAENLLLADGARAELLSGEAVAMADRLGNDDARVAALLSRHAALLHPEHLAERVRVGDEVVATARRQHQRDLEALGRHWLLYDLLELGDLPRAEEVLADLERLAAELRQPLYRHSSLVWRGVLEQLAGRYDRVEQLAAQALALADGASAYDARAYYAVQLLVIGIDRGGLDEMWPAVRPLAGSPRALWAPALAVCELARGDRDGAARALADMPVERPSQLRRDLFWLPTLVLFAQATADLRDDAYASELYELLAPYGDHCAQLAFNGSFGSVHRVLGLLAGQLGRPDDAAAHFGEALRRHAALGAPALEARTCADFAEAIRAGRATGTTDRARRLSQRGLRAASACGAELLVARLENGSQSALAGSTAT
ncbi:MAG: hypothetical protein QOG15_1909 [Solirubrobacteraceae bacterium]|nr:hypothetical protein [Solirubrobacteraceae bacterium]